MQKKDIKIFTLNELQGGVKNLGFENIEQLNYLICFTKKA